MEKYILSVDNGGTYIKAGIYDLSGRQLGVARRRNRPISPKPGYVEYDPDALWALNCACMREALRETGVSAGQIAAIGISAQGSGCYFIGKNGETVRNFIASSDTRALAYSDGWSADGTDARCYERIFRNSAPGQTNAVLAWMKAHEPDHYAQIGWIFSMKDYLLYRLTGNILAGRGCMSSTGLMNLRNNRYDAALAEAFGIPEVLEKLAPQRWDVEAGGTLRPEAAAECGCLPGTPVSCGSHDVIATAFAMGAIDPRYCFSIMGTLAINAYISPHPVLDGSVRYNEVFALPGRYLIEEPGSASSGVLEWAIDVLFGADQPRSAELYGQINRMVESIDPRESVPVFIPFLRGHNDNPRMRGAWVGLEPGHTRAHMLAAVYEGAVFSHMMQLERLMANRSRPEALRVGGGASNSEIWMQIFADALGLPIETMPDSEMGAKGAAIVASVAAGLYPDTGRAVAAMAQAGKAVLPRPEFSPVYGRRFTRFKKVLESMDAAWTVLNPPAL